MRSLAPLFVLGCLLAILSAAAPDRAHAQGRLVVESFRGPRASGLRAMLVEDLRAAGWVVLEDTDVRSAVRELGLRGSLADEDYAQIARALNAVGIVTGSVSRARRSWRLTVRVRNGADGAELGNESWGGRTTAAMDAVGRSGATRLAGSLAAARAPRAAQAAPAESPPAWYAQQEERPEPPPSDDDGGDDDEPRPASERDGRFDAVRFSVSGGSAWRSLRGTAAVYEARRGGMPANPATALLDEDRGYTSSGIGHAEFGVEGEFYPGALGSQPFPFLGALVSFRHSAFLTSYGCRRSAAECTGDGRVNIGTDQMDVQAGLRARVRFGSRRGDFEMFAEGLWGLSTFTLDPVALAEIDFDTIVAPMEYQYVTVGGGFQVAPVFDALTLSVRADYRPGLSIGAKSREVWGVDTGPASGFLVGAELRHDATWVGEGAFAALRFEYFQFDTRFQGQVGCASPGGCPDVPPDRQWMDPNLWEPWPVDASNDVVGGFAAPVVDRYVRWGLYLGYAFR